MSDAERSAEPVTKRTKPLSKKEKERQRKAANARVLAEYRIGVGKSVQKEKEDKT